jgi:hypothetical protein
MRTERTPEEATIDAAVLITWLGAQPGPVDRLTMHQALFALAYTAYQERRKVFNAPFRMTRWGPFSTELCLTEFALTQAGLVTMHEGWLLSRTEDARDYAGHVILEPDRSVIQSARPLPPDAEIITLSDPDASPLDAIAYGTPLTAIVEPEEMTGSLAVDPGWLETLATHIAIPVPELEERMRRWTIAS